MEDFKSGFIAIVGRPNVGKSTFMNRAVGQKITIISDKPQTTRNKIQGIVTDKEAQMVFIDTPGIHKPKHRLGDFMVKVAESALNEVDVVMFMVNADQGYGKGDQFILDLLQKIESPIFLIINKIDLIHPDELLSLIDLYREKLDFAEIVPISALTGNNVPRLMDTLKKYLPEGPKFYDEDQITDHPERFIISELVREKVLEYTREEIPHSVAVVIDNIEKQDDDTVLVQASIITERKSQKGILIGKQGSMLKNIGKKARLEIQSLLGSKIYLDLWVKVQRDWRDKERHLREYGFNDTDY